jgi:hypothetical protein
MKTTTAFIALLGFAVAAATGQNLPTASTSATSASGQFQVQAAQRFPTAPGAAPMFADADIIRVEPTFLVVSAERVKATLWRELQVSGVWKQKVYLFLRPARTANDATSVRTVIGPEGWAVRVDVPDHLTRQQLVRVLTEAVLLEYANRAGTDRAAEIPPWLADGFAYHLFANHANELVLETPRYTANGVTFTPLATSQQRISQLERAHKTLVGETPLTFEELSWPGDKELRGAGRERYLASAQVFAIQLLRLRDGPACYREFLAALPAFRNWQLAFLRGFQPHFTRLLDVDKWWTLESAHFAGRDLTQTWSVGESWSKLAASLREPAQRYANTNALPERADLSLQEVLREWTPAEQKTCVRDKVSELAALRLRLAPEYVGLADEYRLVLENWLRLREPGNSSSGRTIQPAVHSSAGTIRQLNTLDVRLARQRPADSRSDQAAAAK